MSEPPWDRGRSLCFLARRWGKSGDRFREVVGPALELLFLLGFNYPVAFVLAMIAGVP